jgi:hypothetical protein
MRRYSYLIGLTIFCTITILIYGCNRSGKMHVTPVTYDFFYKGGSNISDTISFYTTAPDSSVFAWDFGNNYTSTNSKPTIVYDSVGSYVVTCIINNDFKNVIKKTLLLADPPGCQYTHLISGLRNFKAIVYPYMNPGYTFDTSFSIKILNDIRVVVGHDTLSYFDGYTLSGDVFFYNTNPAVWNYYDQKNSLYYYPDVDSVVIDFLGGPRSDHINYNSYK